VLCPARLFLERLRVIELGSGLAQPDEERGHGYNWYTNIRGRPGFDVVDPSG
jgi:hypothetical protein